MCLLASPAPSAPRCRPSQRASRYAATTVAVKVLEEATPISGPAWV